MHFHDGIEDILSSHKCSKSHFEFDKPNNHIICKDKDALINCEDECGTITQITWYLIQENIDYTVTKDFNIILHVD